MLGKLVYTQYKPLRIICDHFDREIGERIRGKAWKATYIACSEITMPQNLMWYVLKSMEY